MSQNTTADVQVELLQNNSETIVDLHLTGQGEPGVGIPAEGLSGQVLAKASDDDFDTEWVDPSGGGGDSGWETVEENDETYVVPTSEIDGGVALDDKYLFYRDPGDKNHSLAWGYPRHGVDGPVLNGFTAIGVATGDANAQTDELVGVFSSSGLEIADPDSEDLESVATQKYVDARSVPDEPWDIVMITDAFVDVFGGNPFSLGSGGIAGCKWQRVGRTIYLNINAVFSSDHDDGRPGFRPELVGLPTPRFPILIADSVGFAYFSAGETSGGANDGFIIPSMGLAIPTSDPPPIAFGNLTGQFTDGAGGNVFDTATTPVAGQSLSGREFYLIANLIYEAAEPAGD